MANEQLKENVHRLYDAFTRGDFEALGNIMSSNFIEHEFLAPGIPQTRDGVFQWLKGMRQAFPDLHFEAEEVSVDGDRVWVRGVMTGTHRGDFMGVPGSGKSFMGEFFDEIRYDRNKVVEHWGQADVVGMMQQIGITQMSGTQSR